MKKQTSSRDLASGQDSSSSHVERRVEKSLLNTDSNGARKNVRDLATWGDSDSFKLLCKASSQTEGWMESTKALEVPGVGCLVQVTTQQRNPNGDYTVAEALTFAPGARIVESMEDGKVVSRKLTHI